MRNKIYFLAAIMLVSSSAIHAEDFCGDLQNSFGPYDYRKASTEFAHELFLVHSAHFTPDIENGIKGRSGTLGNELDYTLRAFPNHVRALTSLDLLSRREKESSTLKGSRFPVECYFERAVRFAPDDGAARAAYANFLFARGRTEAALQMFIQAANLMPENATINYNLGLAYLKVKNYEQANTYAHKAYALGFPLPALKNMLTAAGKWDDKPE
jgi:tetratricopeptide (TPR) repeat protein